MKKIITLTLICLMTVIFNSYAQTPGEVQIGEYLRDAKLQGLSGQNQNLSSYYGKPFIINVWASWCGPCQNEMGSIQRLARRYGGKQFNVIGISTDDYREPAMAFLKKSKVTFPNYIDSRLAMENMLGANRIPLTLLIDANGKVLDKVDGAQEWDSPEILEAIRLTFKLKKL